MITVYGLRNCDTCRKALAWLKDGGHAHQFLDLRADGLPAGAVGRWCEAAGWETLLNRRSTTWRGLDDAARADLSLEKARSLMEQNPTLIKRPVFETADSVLVGFSDKVKDALNDKAVGR